MIFRRLWRSLAAKANKLANWFRGRDPVAEMQLEYDHYIVTVKTGRIALAMYRGLVERVTRQVTDGKAHIEKLAADVEGYREAGDRATAAKFALELEEAERQATENASQLKLHELTYDNNLVKVQHAADKANEMRARIKKADADLRMSKAEAEIATAAPTLEFDVTSNFGQAEQIVQDQIDTNRGTVRVAADLSGAGLDAIRHDQAAERAKAEAALARFETKKGVFVPELMPQPEVICTNPAADLPQAIGAHKS